MEKEFVNGMYFNQPNENAPDFVLGNVAINKDQFLEWLDKQKPNDKGYIKIDIKMSKKGQPYCELNTYEPQQNMAIRKEFNKTTTTDISDEDRLRTEDLPF